MKLNVICKGTTIGVEEENDSLMNGVEVKEVMNAVQEKSNLSVKVISRDKTTKGNKNNNRYENGSRKNNRNNKNNRGIVRYSEDSNLSVKVNVAGENNETSKEDERLKELENKIKELKNEISNKDEKIFDLEEQINDLEAEAAAEAFGDTEEDESELVYSDTKMDENYIHKSYLDEANKEIEELNKLISELKDKNEKLASEKDSSDNDTIKQLEEDYQIKCDNVDDLKKEIDILNDHIKELSEDNSKSENDNKDLKDKLSDKDAKIQALEEMLQELNEKHEVLEKEYDSIKERSSRVTLSAKFVENEKLYNKVLNEYDHIIPVEAKLTTINSLLPEDADKYDKDMKVLVFVNDGEYILDQDGLIISAITINGKPVDDLFAISPISEEEEEE